MDTEDLELEPEEELPGQMAFFPEEEVPHAPKPPEKEEHVPKMKAPDLTHPPFICILLCDILSQMGGKLPSDWLYDIMVGAGHINYFMYEDVTGFLLENSMAEEVPDKDGVMQYRLLDKGRQCAKLLRLYVPKMYRDAVLLTALRYDARQKALRDLDIACEQTDTDWVLRVTGKDQDREMFGLQIHAPTEKDAQSLGECILRNPAGFFGRVLEMILTNEEEQYDLSDN